MVLEFLKGVVFCRARALLLWVAVMVICFDCQILETVKHKYKEIMKIKFYYLDTADPHH